MLLQDRFCGYCDQPLLMDLNSCSCDLQEPIDLPHYPFNYSASALMEAEAFLDTHPEFKEFNSNPLNSYRRIGAYNTPEQDDYLLPVNYDSDTLPIIPNFLTSETSREDEWDGIYDNRDNYQREVLHYWKDVEPTRCTNVRYQWSNLTNAPGYPERTDPTHVPHLKVRGQLSLFTLEATYDQRYNSLDYSEPALARLEFDELQGFASEQLIDLNITEKYQYRFFNIFVGNDTNLHVGLLTINQDKQQVTCSRKDCYFRTHPLAIPDTTDRSSMESFTHAIIRHGNNHGPDWYITRKDFALIHSEACDANHSRSDYCNNNRQVVTFTTETLEGALTFLIRHRKFCSDTRCRCTAYYHTLSAYDRERQLLAA